MIEEMYKELILDHWRSPQNKGLLIDFDVEGHQVNTNCGDAILLRLKFSKQTVSQVSFDGEGCAISQASASLLTEALKGKSLPELKNLNSKDVFTLLGVEIIPTRLKCALLPLSALHTAISSAS